MSQQRGILTVISGPAGSGKGTVIQELMRQSGQFIYSVSATTRAPRPGEINGVHYEFITRGEFEALIREGAVMEYAEYCGNYYGTPARRTEADLERGKNVILEIEVEGALQIKKKYPEAVLILLLPPSYSVLEARLRGRNTNTEEDILRRLARAREELAHFSEYDYVVLNQTGGIAEAASEIAQIIRCEQQRTARLPELPTRFLAE